MGDQEEVGAHVFVSAISSASWCSFGVGVWTPFAGRCCRGPSAKIPILWGAAAMDAEVYVQTFLVGREGLRLRLDLNRGQAPTGSGQGFP